MPLPPPPPHKRLGQHFLIDPNIVRKIVTLADISAQETVLEIGPGRGVLTRPLCERANRVIAVEVDGRLIPLLQDALQDCRTLDLRHADALTFPYDTLPAGTVAVANLPYYIASPLLFTLLEARHRLDRMVLMLQTEVARRLVAAPGTLDYGILSVLAAYWTRATIAFNVSAQCFRPRPDVGSSVVHMIIRRDPPVPVRDERSFVTLVRAAFAHRRKTLVNSLRDEGYALEQVSAAIRQVAIEPARRAETLTLDQFAHLANALSVDPG